MASRSPLMDDAEFLEELSTIEEGLGASRRNDARARHDLPMTDGARPCHERWSDGEDDDESDEPQPEAVTATAVVAIVIAGLIVGACAAALVFQDRVVAMMR